MMDRMKQLLVPSSHSQSSIKFSFRYTSRDSDVQSDDSDDSTYQPTHDGDDVEWETLTKNVKNRKLIKLIVQNSFDKILKSFVSQLLNLN
jgi:hypothetical protein